MVNKCLSRNSYFCHPESIILSMMCDEDLEIRKNAFEIFLLSVELNTDPRKFELPPINFEAQSLYDLLNTDFVWSPPPPMKLKWLFKKELFLHCSLVFLVIHRLWKEL